MKPINLQETVEEFEANLILQAFVQCDGNKTAAAKLLKLNRTTYSAKFRKYLQAGKFDAIN